MIVERLIFGLWIVAPLVFVFCALWAVLERSAKNKSTHPGEYLKSALFLTLCGLVSYIIHRFALDALVAIIPVSLPRNLYLLMLWPMVLFVGARVIGPSREIRIEKAPDLSQRKR